MDKIKADELFSKLSNFWDLEYACCNWKRRTALRFSTWKGNVSWVFWKKGRGKILIALFSWSFDTQKKYTHLSIWCRSSLFLAIYPELLFFSTLNNGLFWNNRAFLISHIRFNLIYMYPVPIITFRTHSP